MFVDWIFHSLSYLESSDLKCESACVQMLFGTDEWIFHLPSQVSAATLRFYHYYSRQIEFSVITDTVYNISAIDYFSELLMQSALISNTRQNSVTAQRRASLLEIKAV